MAAPPMHRRFQALSQQMVNFDVGEPKESFTVHDQFIRTYAPGLTKLLREQARNHLGQKIVVLSDVSAQTFNHFLDWVFFGRLKTVAFKPNEKKVEVECYNCPEPHPTLPYEDLKDLLKPLSLDEQERLDTLIADTDKAEGGWSIALYVFAIKYDVPLLRQAIVDAYFKDVKGSHPWYRDIAFLARNPITKDTPLLHLLVDCVTDAFRVKCDLTCPDEVRMAQCLPHEVLYRTLVREKYKNEMHPCVYHEHEQDDFTTIRCKLGFPLGKKRKLDQIED